MMINVTLDSMRHQYLKILFTLTKDQNFNPHKKVRQNSRLLFFFLDRRLVSSWTSFSVVNVKFMNSYFFSILSSRSGQWRAVTTHLTIQCDTTKEHPKYRWNNSRVGLNQQIPSCSCALLRNVDTLQPHATVQLYSARHWSRELLDSSVAKRRETSLRHCAGETVFGEVSFDINKKNK